MLLDCRAYKLVIVINLHNILKLQGFISDPKGRDNTDLEDRERKFMNHTEDHFVNILSNSIKNTYVSYDFKKHV